MWHIAVPQGIGDNFGMYLWNYGKGKVPDNSDWSYSADIKGIGDIEKFGLEVSSRNPVVGTVGSEWSRISQTGQIGHPWQKTIVMYFDTTNSPLDVYIKLPKLEIGNTPTPWSPAPEDVM
ncbi:Predicted cell-wall-anchored protein SasA (LPXTG motif) [Ligilactobacillus acidipiscis]|nr:Predicted cell-wall-anchored protein SasA (LPXTG motif) [Ligilactobacillus acidipiscis]